MSGGNRSLHWSLLEPLYTTEVMSPLTEMNVNAFYCVYIFRGASSFILCGVSVLTSTAISVDRLLALLLGLRYRHVVTLRRVRVVITCFWLTAVSIGLLRVWRKDIVHNEATVILTLSLITSIFCYTTIHLKLRRQQAHVQNNGPHGQQNGEGIPQNIARYKKTVSSIMWVQLTLLAWYAPWGIVAVVYANGIEHEVA